MRLFSQTCCLLRWFVSSSCSFLLPPGLHTSQSRSSLWLRPQRDLYFELSQMVRSWSLPGHGQAGWSAPPHLCQSGGSLLPGAPCIGLYMASLIPLCPHIGLVFSGTGLPCGSRWRYRPRWSPRRWCCAWWAKSAQSRCSCVYLSWLNKYNTDTWSFHTF